MAGSNWKRVIEADKGLRYECNEGHLWYQSNREIEQRIDAGKDNNCPECERRINAGDLAGAVTA